VFTEPVSEPMTRKPRILIVEDEAAIRNGLIDVFVYHGFEVESAAHGEAGLKMALGGTFDLVLLDVMLPGIDGFEICDRIRQQDRQQAVIMLTAKSSQQAVIMLTAKSSDEDIVQGLTLGADDYVAKPFSVTQLVLRVQAVLRRSSIGAAAEREIRLANGVVIDTENLCAGELADNIAFTRREMDLLQYLQQQAQRPVSREELLARVWGYANHLEIETRTVDIHIAKLRRKIEADPANPQAIITVRGAGYRLLLQDA